MDYTCKLLIAKPNITDPVFGGKVVFIARYDPDKGAEGYILNGPSVGKVAFGSAKAPDDVPANMGEVIERVEEGSLGSVELFMGGPCGQGCLAMLHGYEQFLPPKDETDETEYDLGITFEEEQDEEEATPKIMDGVYYGHPVVMAMICNAGLEHENKFRFFAGLSSWSPGQLESEIQAGAWDVVEATPDIIFNQYKIAKLVPQQSKQPKWQNWSDFNPSNN